MKPHYMLGMTTALAVVLALALPSSVRAQGPALTGKVTSAAEGAMEGVVVTAHKDGSVVSVSVTTNAQGVYSFPEDRLEPGHYIDRQPRRRIRSRRQAGADVVGEKTTNVDLKLDKTKNLADQLTNAEWMMSIPGTEDQKAALLNCTSCHTWNASCVRRTTPTSGRRWSAA